MANTKQNPLIGAFRAPVAESPPIGSAAEAKPIEESRDAAAKPVEAAKAAEEKKPAQAKTAAVPKQPEEEKPAAAKAAEKPKATEADTAPAEKKPEKETAPPAKAAKKDAKPDEKPKEETTPEDKKAEITEANPDLRFVPLSEIVPLPGTYVKDKPRDDYTDLIASIKKSGLEKPVILRRGEKGEFQLVDGFHRCQALEKAGMREVRAELYDMALADAARYRKEHRADPDLPIPGKLVPKQPPEPEIPADFRLPITREGQSEIITTLNVADIHPFEGHPFNVKDDKDMEDLVESVRQFGVLEPAVVIPRKAGGFEMVSGHRRRRACELAGIVTMPVIVRQLDRDEAVISMVDANLKRENISPMEKARAYKMKLEAMKRKAGRRSKEEAAALEASGKKPMRADEELAQQTGESRSNIQKLVRLNNLTPELQQMVEEKKLPVHTASDLSYLKKEEQAAVADAIEKEAKVPSGTQAAELKKASQAGTLTTDKIEKAVAPTKREEQPPLKVTLGEEDLRPYFPDRRTTIPDAKRGVLEGLDLRKKALERRKALAEKAGKEKKPPAPAR